MPSSLASAAISAPRGTISHLSGWAASMVTTAFFGQISWHPISTTPNAALRPFRPPPHARNAFTTITSLMPGTLPCGEHADAIEFHCLDVEQPVVAQLAEEERRLAAALAPDAAHG